MGSERTCSGVVGAEVTRLKFPFDQSLLTSAATRTDGGTFQGGTALPACLGAGERSRLGGRDFDTPKPGQSFGAKLVYGGESSPARKRLGVRRETPHCEVFDWSIISGSSNAVESGAASRLCGIGTALQGGGAHIVPGGNVRGSHPIPTLHETGCKPVLPS